MHIPISLRANKKVFQFNALIDSGAEGSFIHSNTVREHNIPTHPLKQPILVKNVDGSQNKEGIISQYVWKPLQLGNRVAYTQLLVTTIGKEEIILGLPWLRKTNPQINWAQSTIQINQAEFDRVYFPKEQKPQYPAYCKPWAKVFEKKAAERFPNPRQYDHAIDLKPNFVPTDCPTYSLTIKEQEALKEFISENLRKGYIRPSKSPQASPFFFVPKKSGELRPCQDYRKLNTGTIRNAYPLPLIADLIDKLQHAKFFTKLDLRNGYNNIRIKNGDQWKAAFKTPLGLFEPTVMFFGLCNSPATFQMFMNDIFRELILKDGILIYMDDILIPANDLEELRKKTKRVLSVLLTNDLFVKPEKCEFEKEEVEFLGIVIKPGTLNMAKDKLKGILEWPTPKNVKNIRQFLGFCNFYRRFIPNFANISHPLNVLTRSRQPWNWSESQETAFRTLKNIFSKEPTLLLPDINKPFFVETDASLVATGGVLYQLNEEGQHQPCSFISNALEPAQQRYEIFDRELLAIIRALKTWRHYLLHNSHPITIWTDHENLTRFKSFRKLSPRQVRWQNFLSMYNIQLQHKPGAQLIGADIMSRRPDHIKAEDPVQTMFPTAKFIGGTLIQLVDNAEIKEAQEQDLFS